MSLPVVWSPKAYDKYLEFLAYWHKRSLSFALKMDDGVEDLLKNLRQFKDLCPASVKRPSFRKCVVMKRYSLIYRNDKEMIWIVDILDNRKKHGY